MLSEEVNDKSWYLVYSKPGKEKIARENLERQGYETYLPLINSYKRRRSKNIVTIEPLFPRYLFIHLNQVTDNWWPIRSTKGVSRIITFDYIPARVPEVFLSALMKNDNEAGIQCLQEDGYKPGETIQIIDGPMKHYQGIFMAQTSKERVIILLNMLGNESRLSIPADYIASVD